MYFSKPFSFSFFTVPEWKQHYFLVIFHYEHSSNAQNSYLKNSSLPNFKKIRGKKAGVNLRAGNKFRISWQSFIECLLWSHLPPLLKLLRLTEGRAHPSTNNAHNKTLIENDHFCVQAVVWISSQRYSEEKKKKQSAEAFCHQSHPTNACLRSINSDIFSSDPMWKLL